MNNPEVLRSLASGFKSGLAKSALEEAASRLELLERQNAELRKELAKFKSAEADAIEEIKRRERGCSFDAASGSFDFHDDDVISLTPAFDREPCFVA